MFRFYFAISLTVISNALYHIFQKQTPGNAHPLVTLAVTYATATILCFLLLLLPIGLLFFTEKLSPVNLAGILVCIVGLLLVNYK